MQYIPGWVSGWQPYNSAEVISHNDVDEGYMAGIARSRGLSLLLYRLRRIIAFTHSLPQLRKECRQVHCRPKVAFEAKVCSTIGTMSSRPMMYRSQGLCGYHDLHMLLEQLPIFRARGCGQRSTLHTLYLISQLVSKASLTI